MDENEIIDGTDETTLMAWMGEFMKTYGHAPKFLSELTTFVETREPSSGQIARHDPERMARAQRAGEIIGHVTCCGFNALDGNDQNFIMGVLVLVRDGKA